MALLKKSPRPQQFIAPASKASRFIFSLDRVTCIPSGEWASAYPHNIVDWTEFIQVSPPPSRRRHAATTNRQCRRRQMNIYTTLLPILLMGMAALMAGILFSREKMQSLKSAFIESLAWGFGFFIFFSIEILAFASI
jgi:hypothetical protein